MAREARTLRRLNQASSRLWRTNSLTDGLHDILHTAIKMIDADKGNIHLLDPARGILTIAAQQGFERPFLALFEEVSATDGSACGRALRHAERVIIEDVEADEDYAPFRAIARETGFRSVQSTPLIGRGGKVLGVISTHFREAHRPASHECALLDLHARNAADFIERLEREKRIELLLHEVRHRAKNLLALIQAIARQTVMSSPQDFLAKFESRIAFLARGTTCWSRMPGTVSISASSRSCSSSPSRTRSENGFSRTDRRYSCRRRRRKV